jgi:hypothetical protein
MRVSAHSLSSASQVTVFYLQAISLVDFMIRSHGSGAFTVFCRELRDTGDAEKALGSAYPITLDTVDDLEAAWKKYVNSR